MCKKILLINEGYSDNLGDQAIKDSLIFLLKNNIVADIEFADFTKKINAPLQISSINQVSNASLIKKVIRLLIPAKIRWIISSFSRIVSKSKEKKDLIVIGGGQLILSNATFAIAMFLWVFVLNLFGNKNIILFGVGSGTNFSFIDKLLYQYSLHNVKDIYVRDYKSKELLKELFNIDAKFVYDVAFCYSLIDTKNIDIELSNKVLLGVTDFEVYKTYNKDNLSIEEYYESWITLLKTNHIDIKNTILFYTTQRDSAESVKFMEYVNNKYAIDLTLLETNTIGELINAISSSEYIVSGRMHALILGVSYRKKIITYSISKKLEEFDRMFNKGVDLKEVQNQIVNQVKIIL